jgi:hypothetical protein
MHCSCATKNLAPKGINKLGSTTSGERGLNITMAAAINAVGNRLPPILIFPRVHFKSTMLNGGPVGSKRGASPSGLSNERLSVEFNKIFPGYQPCQLVKRRRKQRCKDHICPRHLGTVEFSDHLIEHAKTSKEEPVQP